MAVMLSVLLAATRVIAYTYAAKYFLQKRIEGKKLILFCNLIGFVFVGLPLIASFVHARPWLITNVAIYFLIQITLLIVMIILESKENQKTA